MQQSKKLIETKNVQWEKRRREGYLFVIMATTVTMLLSLAEITTLVDPGPINPMIFFVISCVVLVNAILLKRRKVS